MLKKIFAIVCCLVLCLTLTACGSTGFGSLKYTEIPSADIPTGTIIAQNSKYTLKLNHENMGIVLVDNDTKEEWGSSPKDSGEPKLNEFGLPAGKDPMVESILTVECKNFESNEVNTYYASLDAVSGGKVSYYTVDNGIVIRYFFTEAQVMIPLKCVLTENGVNLSVDPTMIQEKDNRVLKISIAPFFNAVENDAKNSYLFVPSGSGALVDVKSKSIQGDSYSAQIYGADPAIDEVALTSTKESVKLNVFGAKMGKKAVCAIVDGSPASAWIDVTSGSTTYGYSSCYATFQMRGYTNHVAELFSYERVENVVYSKKMIDKPISVTYYPLSDKDANYSGMAKVYREYLINNYQMNTSTTDIPLNIRVLGGTELTKSFVGIPYKTVYPTTTLDAAQKIMDEVNQNVGSNFTVQFKGFGENGIDVGDVAGNYALSDKLGTADQLKKISASAQSKNIGLYFDFDIERFNKNSSGFSKFFDSVTNAGERKAVQYYYDVAVKDKKLETAYNILSPANFGKVFKKVLKATNKYNISGISLDTASSTAYSDYIDKENAEYYSKNGFPNAVSNIIMNAKANNKKFMATDANLYSAVMADVITESPISSDKSNIFMYDIPFYQMVFKGSVPITTRSINLESDSKLALLKAVESGSGLSFTVTDNWDSSVIDSNSPYFYNSVFDDVKDDIFEYSKELSDYYKKISGTHIKKHTVSKNGLRETVFENGVKVYVNYTDKTLQTPIGKIAPYEYLITE